MGYNIKYIWITTASFICVLKPVNVQFAIPGFFPHIFPAPPPPPPPPIFPMMPPNQMIAPSICFTLPPGAGATKTKTTTTTTTQKTEMEVAIGIPVPMPMPAPMPVPMPAPMPPMFPIPPMQVPGYSPHPNQKNCPPCPPCVCKPSCTPPAFSYCSPCHLKCRCRSAEEAPEPMQPNFDSPIYAIPPPVVVVPYPAIIRPPNRRPRNKRKYISTSCSDESDSSSDSFYPRIGKERCYKHKRVNFNRRKLLKSDSENEVVKPMLSYIGENGDIKFETKISNDDAAELLGENKINNRRRQTVQVFTSVDEMNKPQVVVVSKDSATRRHGQPKQVLMDSGLSNHVLREGKKELVFKPPDDKKISNLSVSFQIS